MQLESTASNKNMMDNDGDLFVPWEVKFSNIDSNAGNNELLDRISETNNEHLGCFDTEKNYNFVSFSDSDKIEIFEPQQSSKNFFEKSTEFNNSDSGEKPLSPSNSDNDLLEPEESSEESSIDKPNKPPAKKTRKSVPKEILTRKRLTNKSKWIHSVKQLAVN